jgi:hypothetical protein
MFEQIFSAGGGVIYPVNDQNQLMWFRHDGCADGSFNWAEPAGKVVGIGWTAKAIFSGATLQP